MKQNKIMIKVHTTQAKLRKTRKGLSWNQEAELIDQIAKKIAKKYAYRVFPTAKKPYAVSAAS